MKNISEERKIPRIIEMNEDLTRDNDELAGRNHKILKEHNIKSIDVVGSIGSGKTSIISMLASRLKGKKNLYVICGDITLRLDADRIQDAGAKTIQINTGRECALNAYHIKKVLSALPLDEIDLLVIENVGNLICPSDFILGVDKRIMVVSVSEGDHVVIKHPLLVKMSEILLINKIDLVEAMDTDLDRMINDAKSINPNIEIFPISVKTGENCDKLVDYFLS